MNFPVRQTTNYSCGPASLATLARWYGVRLSEKRAATLAQTSKDGTSSSGLCVAIRELGFKSHYLDHNDPLHAWGDLVTRVFAGGACLLMIHNWEHWVCVAGFSARSKSVLVHDPDQGTFLANRKKLLGFWRCRKLPHFFGIAVE